MFFYKIHQKPKNKRSHYFHYQRPAKKKQLRIKSTFKKNNKLLGVRECYVIVFQLGHDTLLVVNLRG